MLTGRHDSNSHYLRSGSSTKQQVNEVNEWQKLSHRCARGGQRSSGEKRKSRASQPLKIRQYVPSKRRQSVTRIRPTQRNNAEDLNP